MTAIAIGIIESLHDDLVSHGWLAQCIRDSDDTTHGLILNDVPEELLTSGKVEFGITKIATVDHVEFIAWKGSIAERISRAASAVNDASDSEKDFAYWLCLRENVDRYEVDSRL